MGEDDQPVRMPSLSEVDISVRRYVYDHIFNKQSFPRAAEIAEGLGLSLDEVRESFRRMKDAHILVLQEGDEEVLMANPFSAVPTPFVVQIGSRSWWGNCIWDAMGIAAMVKGDARIVTACADCNDAMALLVNNGAVRLEQSKGTIHFSVPARRWWENIKFT